MTKIVEVNTNNFRPDELTFFNNFDSFLGKLISESETEYDQYEKFVNFNTAAFRCNLLFIKNNKLYALIKTLNTEHGNILKNLFNKKEENILEFKVITRKTKMVYTNIEKLCMTDIIKLESIFVYVKKI